MTRLGRRTTRLVAFSLLASTATAHAECAWVLWSELNVTNMQTEWQIGVATKSQDACQSLMKQEIEARRKATGGRMLGGDTVVSDHGGGVVIRRYVCLPDTVDPRGAKTR
jgi:hypothetical protein